jgi:hypothetical protein
MALQPSSQFLVFRVVMRHARTAGIYFHANTRRPHSGKRQQRRCKKSHCVSTKHCAIHSCDIEKSIVNISDTKAKIRRNMNHGVHQVTSSAPILVFLESVYFQPFQTFAAASAARVSAASSNVFESTANPMIFKPLSTYIVVPVTAEAKGEHKKAATRPTSIA